MTNLKPVLVLDNGGYKCATITTPECVRTSDGNGIQKFLNNPNLLDNSDFSSPVNQRALTLYSFDEGYSIDRWKIRFSGDGVLTVLDDCISLYRATYQIYLHQILDHPERYAFKTWTLSVYAKGKGSIGFFNSGTRLASKDFNNDNWAQASLTYTFGVLDPTNTVSVELANQPNQKVFLKWAKLEEGSIATPYIPKGYGVEVAECMRYFQVFSAREIDYSIACRFNKNYAELDYCCAIPMRIVPSVVALYGTNAGRIVAVNSAGGLGVLNVDSINLGASNQHRITLVANYASTDISTWVQASYDTARSGCSTIAFSADL